MHSKNIRSLWLLLMMLALGTSLPVKGQEPALNAHKWEQLKREVEWKKVKPEKTAKKQSRESSPTYTESQPVTINIGPVVQIIVISVFIILIVLILVSLIRGSQGIRTQKAGGGTDAADDLEIGEDLHKSDLEKWLDSAMAAQNYKLVVRIYFLMILKALENRRLIRWEREKTNWHYIQELGNDPLQAPFQKLVLEYDELWYGEKDYPEDAIMTKMEKFKDFNRRVTHG